MAGFGGQQDKRSNKAQKKIKVFGKNYLKIAIILHAKGDIASAEKAYREAIRAGFDHQAIFSNLGVICKNSGRSEEAISWYKKATEINPYYSHAYTNLGEIYKELGNLDQALAYTLKSIDLNPDNPTALTNLGGVYKDLGNLDQALACTLKSIDLNPDNPTALTNLGGVYKDLGNLDQALAYTLKSIDRNPDNPTALTNLGGVYKDLGNLDQALAYTLKSIDRNPDNPTALTNLGGIYKDLGNLDKALAYTLKSIDLNPDNPTALTNLGGIYKDLGNLDQALAYTLKSIDRNPDCPTALTNLGGIYKDLGNLDQALACTLKSIELNPKGSKALCKLGSIKMTLGKYEDAKKHLLDAIAYNTQECEAYFLLSCMLKTEKDSEELINSIKQVNTSHLSLQTRSFVEFSLSNCFHILKKYDNATNHLKTANADKLKSFPSNYNVIQNAITYNLAHFEHFKKTTIHTNCGKNKIFIVGMPRSGSTLLETILSMNPEIKDLGESRSLKKAIAKFRQQEGCNSNYKSLDEIYSQMEHIDNKTFKYTTDKNLYNFIRINWIAEYMPRAKIVHCRRNPMDNILSMHKNNLSSGNSYTADLKDAAKILIAQEQAMQIQKNRYSAKIFTFDYDQFVNAPKQNLSRLLEWLGLRFDQSYLHPEKSTKCVSTASFMQARRPISNKSVGGWKNYQNLLKPALRILQESGIPIE